MTCIFLTLALILVVSSFISYPDIISGRILISTLSPPVEVVSNSAGKIHALFAQDGQTVGAGTVVAAIENTGNLEDILTLKCQVDALENALQHPDSVSSFQFSQHLVTGTMQETYNRIITSLENYKDLQNTRYFSDKNSALKEQVNNYRENIKVISNQISIAQEELDLVKQHYAINEQLYDEGVKSKIQFEEDKAVFLKKMREIQVLEKTLIDHRIFLSQTHTEQLDLQREEEVLFRDLNHSLSNNIHLIEGQIRQWEQQFLLKAPIGGKVVYKEKWEENQFIGNNDHFMTIVNDSEALVGYMEVSSHGLGKVQIGQMVRIRLDAYPEDQYGQVMGRVENIALLPNDGSYRIRVRLQNGLLSSYGILLGFKPELSGYAEILTKDLSLLSRLFDKFNHLINNKL
ncbi:hemolysin [Echinicola rosea]|uniref:Hemolysin n=2 Tax=Echinicola rosea TaxID=1807691 RepID=A0ABQ1V904_9BACT|nr:hemolysin [Echinicola rosea]